MPFFIPQTDPVPHQASATPFARFCLGIESRLGWVARCVVWAVVFQLVCLAYLPSLKGPFLYDDIDAIVGNQDLRAPLEPWRILRDHEISLHFDRRPVSGLVTLVDFQLWGLNARGYRMTNLFLHFASGLAIAALAIAVSRRMGSRYPLLFGHLLALVWLLHPLATSTVSFIFQRSEILMTLFFILSLYCLVRSGTSRQSTGWLILSLTCAFLAGLSKETGLTIILAVPLFARVCLFPSWKAFLKERTAFLIVLLAGTVAIAVWVRTGVRFTELNQSDMELNGSWAYFKSQGPVIANYLKLVVFPHPLSFLPRYDPVPGSLGFLPYFLGLSLVSVVLLVKGRKEPWIWLCLGGFLIVLAPTSSFIPIPLEPEAEFRMYLPLAFVLAGALAWLGKMILNTRFSPVVGHLLLLVLVGTEIAASMARNRVYSSAKSLWEDSAMKSPANAKSWINLGFCYVDLGEYDRAQACADRLLFWGTSQNSQALLTGGNHVLASVLLASGKASEARGIFENLSRDNPESPGIRIGLIHALAASGSHEKALQLLRRHYPDPFDCHPIIARLYGGIFRITGSVEEEKKISDHLEKLKLGLKIIDLGKAGPVTGGGDAGNAGVLEGGNFIENPAPNVDGQQPAE